MKLHISHVTRYVYDAPLRGECFMEARLRPLSVPGEQTCREFTLTADPAAPIYSYGQPGQLGTVHHFILRDQPQDVLTIHAESTVNTLQANPFAGVTFDSADWPMLSQPGFADGFAEWLAPTEFVPLHPTWPGPSGLPSVFGFGQELSRMLYTEFEYVPGATEVNTPLAEFVAQRRGVCQDFAHLMLSAARTAGVPARYVSGYIYPGGDPSTHGAGATHAWVELYLPHAGTWKGFDPTNNIVVADRHVKIAVGRDYSDVPPTKGLLRAAPGQKMPQLQRLEVQVSAKRLGA